MSSLYLTLGIVTALFSAGRSTWSPCGLSMLSSITPFGERARGTRYAWTSAWFFVGAVAGGASLGAIASLLTLAISLAFGLSGVAGASGGLTGVVLAVVCSAAGLLGAAADLGAFGAVLPVLRRQVDDGWMARLRPWVYGSGFGWQIGFGMATYVMTAGVAVTIVFSVAAGLAVNSVLATLAVCMTFGAARGATILLTSKADTPERLREVHRRLDRLEEPVKFAAAIAQAASVLAIAGSLVIAGPGFASRPRQLLWPLLLAALAGALAIVAPTVRSLRFERTASRPVRDASPHAPASPRAPASRRVGLERR